MRVDAPRYIPSSSIALIPGVVRRHIKIVMGSLFGFCNGAAKGGKSVGREQMILPMPRVSLWAETYITDVESRNREERSDRGVETTEGYSKVRR